jgi:hypothetical protein
VLGGASGARLGVDYAHWFGLAHALTGVGLDRFRGGKFTWLAFRHGKYEYGGSAAEVEGPEAVFAGMEI